MILRVGGSSAVTGRELSRCQLWVGFARVLWVMGEGKRNERANEQGRAAAMARRENR